MFPSLFTIHPRGKRRVKVHRNFNIFPVLCLFNMLQKTDHCFGRSAHGLQTAFGWGFIFVINNIMKISAPPIEMVCLECFSTDCRKEIFDSEIHGVDEYARCMRCGSYDIAYRDSAAFDELWLRGVISC